jgi:hypothetical protein
VWYRAKWAIVGAGVLAVLVIAGGAVAVAVTRGGEQTSSSAPTSAGRAAVQEWWSAAREHFTGLQNALDDSQRALDLRDGPALEEAVPADARHRRR